MEENLLNVRGKCKEMSEKLCSEDPSLKLVRGWYYEPFWDREDEHWWCEDYRGNIIDPTASQFPSNGHKNFYRKFDGKFKCSECGKECCAETMRHEGRFHLCSEECLLDLVGISKECRKRYLL